MAAKYALTDFFSFLNVDFFFFFFFNSNINGSIDNFDGNIQDGLGLIAVDMLSRLVKL